MPKQPKTTFLFYRFFIYSGQKKIDTPLCTIKNSYAATLTV